MSKFLQNQLAHNAESFKNLFDIPIYWLLVWKVGSAMCLPTHVLQKITWHLFFPPQL